MKLLINYNKLLAIIIFLLASQSLASELSDNKAAKIYAHFLELINKNSKNEISNKEVLRTSISSVLKRFKDDSYFIDENSYNELSKIGKGHFYGIGINLVNKKGIYSIKNILEGSPAYKYGLRENDIILKMAGIQLSESTISKALAESNLSSNKELEILIKEAKTAKIVSYKIPKAEIKIKNIESRQNGNILYIKIKAFNSEVVKDIESIIKNANINVSGYIIDLRDNFGGLLHQAVGLIDLILDEGLIVGIDYKSPKPKEVFYAKKGNIFGSKKIIILVNNKSASASEIVASALQDHKRAIIMGSKTYGKTTVQQLYKLDEIGAVAITIARYYRPNGTFLDKGVTPDIIEDIKSKSSHNTKEDQLLEQAFVKLAS